MGAMVLSAPLAACAAPMAVGVASELERNRLEALDRSTLVYARDAGIAAFMVGRCSGAGIGFSLGTSREMNLRFFDEWERRGYTADEINAAAARISEGDIEKFRQSYFGMRGVDPTDTRAICDLARSEMDQRTTLGRMMREI